MTPTPRNANNEVVVVEMLVGAGDDSRAPLTSAFWDHDWDATIHRVVDIVVAAEAEAAADDKDSADDDRATLTVLNLKVDLCRALLSHCADATAAIDDTSRTNNIGLADVLDVLAAAFANVNAKNRSDETVVMYAAG